MKRKILGSVVALSLVLTMLCGCSGSKDGSDDVVYGQITKIDDKGITIDVGTLDEDMFANMNVGGPNAGEDIDANAGDDASTDAVDNAADAGDDGSGFSGDNANRPDMDENRPDVGEDRQFDGNVDGNPISQMITLSGDEKTYKITDDTVYKSRAFGGRGGFGMDRQGGPFGENGSVDPESAPDRESVNTEDGDDNAQDNIPEGDMPEGGAPQGDMPTGDRPTGGRPDGESFPDREDMDFDLEDMSGMDEEISSDELEVGDMVEITLDKHGKIDTITVFMFGMMGRQDGDDRGEDTSDLGENTQAFYENRMQA